MSPSRGELTAPIENFTEQSTDAKADIRSSSALASAKRNLAFLYNPQDATHSPVRLRTRALLRSLRYIGIFIFWRVVRYAKYALVGSIVAAIGTTAFGGVISGAAFLAAPPTIAASLGIGLCWSIGRWGFRKLGAGEKMGRGAVREVGRSGQAVRSDGTWRDIQGPRAVPW